MHAVLAEHRGGWSIYRTGPSAWKRNATQANEPFRANGPEDSNLRWLQCTLSGRRTSNDSALLNKDGDACCVISCSYCCGQSEHGASRERDGPRRSLRVGVCPFGDTNRNKPRLFFNACMPPCETKSALPHARPLFFLVSFHFPPQKWRFYFCFIAGKKLLYFP
jgi:hypothetical protein